MMLPAPSANSSSAPSPAPQFLVAVQPGRKRPVWTVPFLLHERPLITSIEDRPAAPFNVSMLAEQAFYEDELPNGPAYGLDNVFGSITEVV
jgi:hypothetical protein